MAIRRWKVQRRTTKLIQSNNKYTFTLLFWLEITILTLFIMYCTLFQFKSWKIFPVNNIETDFKKREFSEKLKIPRLWKYSIITKRHPISSILMTTTYLPSYTYFILRHNICSFRNQHLSCWEMTILTCQVKRSAPILIQSNYKYTFTLPFW